MTDYSLSFLNAAHKHSIFNRAELSESQLCGCFYCLEIFEPKQIVEWVDEGDGKVETAMCPFCGIDSVIGNKSEYPATDETFLKAMYDQFFN